MQSAGSNQIRAEKSELIAQRYRSMPRYESTRPNIENYPIDIPKSVGGQRFTARLNGLLTPGTTSFVTIEALFPTTT